ncbi:MAG: hypothetical protein DIZ77_12270 [endosymbiont of Seepiophila jonesi]|uniref:Peptidase M56 domain-containing protein n=1 Tax=endosymbiont of Lamellibrachia luymesi TaxID=2200907 RepID=A0A370DXZ2_9GAMM|nr:MAG: hypothetical protein DIZ77_12270 [endosymbiont of Seepiophila jonesi]RDH91072.1 MAG: hypothetical protein DIZ79_07335 [endosymbiont of Lamellibrachia luymesi]
MRIKKTPGKATPICLGWLRPRIFMSCGMLRRLNSSELGVVMAHEQSHARRRDALRLALASPLCQDSCPPGRMGLQ